MLGEVSLFSSLPPQLQEEKDAKLGQMLGLLSPSVLHLIIICLTARRMLFITSIIVHEKSVYRKAQVQRNTDSSEAKVIGILQVLL